MMKRLWAIVPAAAVLAALPLLTRAADTGAGGGPDTGMTNMLIGQDAFGGWQDNKPGVWRKIGAGDLPQPFATKSASNAPGLVQRPAGAVPEVPPGFKAELVASGMNAPRDMALAPDGDVFVADSAADEIVVLRMADGQAKPTAQSVFASAGLDQPYGIAFYPHDKPQWVYVGNTGSVVRFPYKSGDLKASARPRRWSATSRRAATGRATSPFPRTEQRSSSPSVPARTPPSRSRTCPPAASRNGPTRIRSARCGARKKDAPP